MSALLSASGSAQAGHKDNPFRPLELSEVTGLTAGSAQRSVVVRIEKGRDEQ